MIPKKFIFVGPESSGKTTLCKLLSEKYNTLWVQEYCRVAAEEKLQAMDQEGCVADIKKAISLFKVSK